MAKSESGYLFQISGFIKVDPADLAVHARAIAAVQEAKTGQDFAPMLGMASIEKFEVRPVTRRTRKGDGGAE